MTGVLYIVGTPIGNLDDITFRAVDTLKQVDVIAAEDTRITARLLARYGIATPLVSFREENAVHAVPSLVQRLRDGQCVALVSDAGTPSVSDPGQQLVAAAQEAGIRTTPIPGPSALASAISVCGLRGDGVRFYGFLPRSGKTRDARINAIAVDTALAVVYESPHRIGGTLSELSVRCGPRRATLMRELTKRYEEIRVDDLAVLAKAFDDDVRGEITLVVEGAHSDDTPLLSPDALEHLVRQEMARGESAKDISARLAQTMGIRKKDVYALILRLLAE
ncbi:MAG: 16S rRNA (cytidine(1402)-2'-O)-methyltransferase [Proteobacteria bacterium]|nr:16S rRNA (cytidine(1402)-2'-O)-methyltransferase [Pseudomonadota bacterium]